MTKPDYEALAKRVEAGEIKSASNRDNIELLARFEAIGISEHALLPVFAALNGSLDAAKALHEAVLPRWDWSFKNPRTCELHGPERFNAKHHQFGQCDNPATAWVAAIIRAKGAENENP